MTDLSNLTAEELKAELKKREAAKHDKRKAYKELVEQHIPVELERLKRLSNTISSIKTVVFQELQELVVNKKAAYGTKPGQQSHTFTTGEGGSITLGFRVLDAWDDTVNEGIQKVNEFIGSLAKDEDSAKLVNAINRLLKKDAKGNLKANRVVELRNLADEFNDEGFADGVDIIQKAYKPTRSVWFIEASYKKDGEKVAIPLSLSACPFLEDSGIDFDKL